MSSGEKENSFGHLLSRLNLRTLFSEFFFVAILTAGSYWIAYQYQNGFLSAYNVPSELIEVGTENILNAAKAFLPFFIIPFIALTSSFIFSDLISKIPYLKLDNNKRNPLIVFILFILISTAGFIYKYGLDSFKVHSLIIEVIAMTSMSFLFEYHDPHTRKKITDFVDIFGVINPLIILSILVIFFLGFLAETMGNLSAHEKISYLTWPDNDEIAVVQIYHDKILGISFDENKNLQNEIFIKKIDSGETVHLTSRDIGPLHVLPDPPDF